MRLQGEPDKNLRYNEICGLRIQNRIKWAGYAYKKETSQFLNLNNLSTFKTMLMICTAGLILKVKPYFRKRLFMAVCI